MAQVACILCGRPCNDISDFKTDASRYDCEFCGRFAVTRRAKFDFIQHLNKDQLARLSCCTREQTVHGLPPLTLYSGEPPSNAPAGSFAVEHVLNTSFPRRLEDRFNRALGNLSASTSYPGEELEFYLDTLQPLLFAETAAAADFLLDEMQSLEYISCKYLNIARSVPYKYDRTITRVVMPMHITLRAKGLTHIQELDKDSSRKLSRQAFVAMWFSDKMSEACDKGIFPAIEACGFTPRRIDQKETNGKICDEIIAEIRRSRFVVADFTGQRGGVYFEAGFAKGLGMPVIWLCRKDHVKKLHFDTRQYSHIVWETPEDLRTKLENRIRATIPDE